MIEITGIVNKTQIIQKRAHHIVIDINTTKGESERVFPIINGTRKFHSICWIIKYTISTPINPFNQAQSDIDKARSIEIKVHKKGMNSINKAIKARESIQLTCIQNIFNISNQVKVKKNIAIHKISCHFNHTVNIWITSFSLSNTYSDNFLGKTA